MDRSISCPVASPPFLVLGRNPEAKAFVSNQLKEQPQSVPLQQVALRLELAQMTFDERVQAIRDLKQGGWFFACRLAWGTLKSPMIFTDQERRDPKLQAERI
jgi:hypothetical protein